MLPRPHSFVLRLSMNISAAVTTGYVSGSIFLGRETTCLAGSYNVGGY